MLTKAHEKKQTSTLWLIDVSQKKPVLSPVNLDHDIEEMSIDNVLKKTDESIGGGQETRVTSTAVGGLRHFEPDFCRSRLPSCIGTRNLWFEGIFLF